MFWLVISVLVIWLSALRWQRRKKIQCCDQFRNDLVSLPLIGLGHLMLGNGEDKRKTVQTFGREALKHGGLSTFHCWVFNQFYTVVADPIAAELILKNCLEKDDSLKLFRKLFRDGLPVVSVSQWRPRRKTLNPSFGLKHLNQYVEIFSKKSVIMAEKLKKNCGEEPFSIYNHMAALSFDAVCETTFGTESNAQNDLQNQELNALKLSCHLIADRMTQPLFHNEHIYEMTPQCTRFEKAADTLWKFVNKNTEIKYKEFTTCNDDFTEDDAKQNKVPTRSLPRDAHKRILCQETMILMFAGSDTTSVAFSFTCLLLAKYPGVQEKVFEELQEVYGDSKRPIEANDLPQLKYTEAVLKETMRLYPPGLILLRKVTQDLVLPSGQTLANGTGAIIHLWALHRNPEYWGEDAEQFRPERFFDAPPKHPAAFIPFSYGPRNCIAYQFAMMLLKTSLATLARQFRFIPATDKDLNKLHKSEEMRTTFDILNRDVDNFPVRVQARDQCV